MEKYLEALERVCKESEQGKTIVVEGQRDEKRLRALGVRGHIIKIQGKKLYRLVEEELPREVVVLTDFDARGRWYAYRIKYLGERNGIKVNVELRKKLFWASGVQTAESLPLPDEFADKPF